MEQIKQTVVVIFNEYDDMQEVNFDYANPKYVTHTFENAIGYQLGSGFLGVQAADGVMNIYPQERIRQVIVTPAEE